MGKQIDARTAITFCASAVGMASLDSKEFQELLGNLVRTVAAEKDISENDISAVFNVLDFDGSGMLSHCHWTSAIPLFFGGSVDVSAAVFKEIDDDSSGYLDLEEFAKYTTPIVHMLVPPEDKELREQ